MFDGGSALVAGGVFNLGGLSEMELLMEEVVDGGGAHAVQMDPLIDRVAVGG